MTYREILFDLCRMMKIEAKKGSRILDVERRFMMELMRQSLQGMSPDERKEFLRSNDIMPNPKDVNDFSVPALTTAMMVVLRTGGIVGRRMLLTLVNVVMKTLLGRTLGLAASQTLMRSLMVFSGPVGWTINIALFLPFLTGPNKKVTLVATLYIAALRRTYALEKARQKKDVIKNAVEKPANAPVAKKPSAAGGMVANAPLPHVEAFNKTAAGITAEEAELIRQRREILEQRKQAAHMPVEVAPPPAPVAPSVQRLADAPAQDRREWNFDNAWEAAAPAETRGNPPPAAKAPSRTNTPEEYTGVLRRTLGVPRVPDPKRRRSS